MAPVVLSLLVTAAAIFVLHRSREAMWFTIAAGWFVGIWVTAYNLLDPASPNLALPSPPRTLQLLGLSKLYWFHVTVFLGVVTAGLLHGASTRGWGRGLQVVSVLLAWISGTALAVYVGFWV